MVLLAEVSAKWINFDYLSLTSFDFCKSLIAACSQDSHNELGRLPLKSKVQMAAINFWEHIITSQNSLVNKIYSLTEQSNLWVQKVKKITSVLFYKL